MEMEEISLLLNKKPLLNFILKSFAAVPMPLVTTQKEIRVFDSVLALAQLPP